MVKVLSFVRAARERVKLKSAMKAQEIVRLHVIAAGDSAQEQRVKLIVRDAVLRAFAAPFKQAHSAQEALQIIQSHLSGIEEVARRTARAQGYFGPVQAVTGVFPFPDRTYDGVLVPGGAYPALRVILGGGAGQNWWCILYPALCLSIASTDPANVENAAFEWHLPDIFRLWF